MDTETSVCTAGEGTRIPGTQNDKSGPAPCHRLANKYIKENTTDRTKEKIKFIYDRLSKNSKKKVLKLKYPKKIEEIILKAINV